MFQIFTSLPLSSIYSFLSSILMSRRLQPPRAARNQPLSQLKQSPSPPKSIKHEVENEQDVAKKQAESKRKMYHMLNLKKYPYTRALHYFMNLNELPRSVESVSYALVDQKILKPIFSKDHFAVKKSTIGQVINRKLIGLPTNTSGKMPIVNEKNCKNICYGYLFQIEDKKHINDRIIYTIKSILKRLSKMTRNQFEKFDFIKKDSDLQLIRYESTPQSQIKNILEKKLEQLQSRKYINSMNWQFEDKIFFYQALDQKLHKKVEQLKQKLTQEYLFRLLIQKQYQQYQFYHKKQSFQKFISHMTAYYQSNAPTLSQYKIKSLIATSKTSLVAKGCDNKFLTNYPLAILQFGRNQFIHIFTEFLLGRRAFSLGESHFYQVKTMIKKIFGRDLKVKSEKMSPYDHFYKKFRRIYEDVIAWKKNSAKRQIQSRVYPLLDDILNQNLKKGKRENIFHLSQISQITKRQYMFLMTYFWLCQSIEQLSPYLMQFPALIQIIGSEYFSKVCNIIVDVTKSPLVGLIYYIFEALTDLITKSNDFPEKTTHLYFEFDSEINVGMIWREEVQDKKSSVCPQREESMVFSNKKIKTK